MPEGIPTTCLYSLVPNRIKKCCPTKRSAHHIHFNMTMHDIFLGFSDMHFCHYMQCLKPYKRAHGTCIPKKEI